MLNFFKKKDDLATDTAAKPAANLEKRVEQYTNVEGLSTKQLTTGLWYVEHKKLLQWILNGFLIALAAISWTYTKYGFEN